MIWSVICFANTIGLHIKLTTYTKSVVFFVCILQDCDILLVRDMLSLQISMKSPPNNIEISFIVSTHLKTSDQPLG